MGEHTPTPWTYRPNKHDDWGWIRGPKEHDGIAPLVATARSGLWESVEILDEHRRNKTDPYEANAAFIVKCVNSHDALVKALEAVVRDVNEYERLNNLAPTPGHIECWDSIACAKAVLASVSTPGESND